MKKRALSFLAILLSLCLLCSSCAASGAFEPALLTVIRNSISKTWTNATNLLRGNTPLFINGELNYRLEVDGSCTERVNALLSTVEETTGVDLTADVASSKPSLRIGLNLSDAVSASDFFVGFSGEDFIITAKNEIMLAQALDYFEDTFIINEASDVGDGYLFVPKELAFKSEKISLLDADATSLYSIIYPEDADPRSFAALDILRRSLTTATGVTVPLKSDFLSSDSTGEAKEILIGLTNRQESIAATEELGVSSYYIGISGNKIIITAQNGYMLTKAVERFVELFITAEGTTASYTAHTLLLPVSLDYRYDEQVLLLTNNGKSDYTIVYPASAHPLLRSHIEDFRLSFARLTGIYLPMVSDTQRPVAEARDKEILIGLTNRSVSSLAQAGQKPADWSISTSGEKLIVSASDVNPLRFALDALQASLVSYALEQNSTLLESPEWIQPKTYYYGGSPVLLFIPTTFTLGSANAPDLVEVRESAEIGEGAYLLYRGLSSLSVFNEYLTLLGSCGYTRYDANVAGKVHSATYYNDTEILNITFAETDNAVRVAVDPRSEAALHPIKATPYKGRTDVEPLFIQMGDIYVTQDCGMSYIIRLPDGTFVIIDGGWTDESTATSLLNTLQAYNVLDGVPVIACWIFTHGHSDHVGAFTTFTQKYSRKVLLQSVLYTFPNETQTLIHGGPSVNRVQKEFRQYINRYEGDRIVYKARTGQHIQFAGCEIEMLFTYEDYPQPRRLNYFNDSSIVFRLTLSDGSISQSFMMLGDCSTSTAPILVERYDSYLHSDAVQVAHHGYAGGTDALYNAISAAVVFWPCPLNAPKDGSARFSSTSWSPVTRRMLDQDYAKVLYAAAAGNVTVNLTQMKNRTIVGIGMVATYLATITR